MSNVEAFVTCVIAFESCNIFLFGLLLLTPAPKHSIVKALIISCLIRSVLDILPPVVHRLVPRQLGPEKAATSKAESFCVVDSMLLGYVTVVKAAFAVDFTLTFLWLALLQIRPKSSADDHPHLTKRTVVVLCVSPFVWALPVLLTPLARIVHGTPANVNYNISSCYFDDPAFAIISLVFTLIPLGISVIISMALAFIIWRFSNTMLEHSGWLFVKTTRFARFAALVFVTIVSACLYTVVLSQWIWLHHHWAHDSSRWGSNIKWRNLIRASVLWEAITPMFFFFIFAGQEEVYETWLGWLSRLVRFPEKPWDGKPGGCSRNDPEAQSGTSTAHISNAEPPTRSRVACDAEATIAALSPLPRLVPPGKIIARPLSSPFVRLSSYSERGRVRSRSITALNGLTPAPRHMAAKALADTVAETPHSGRSRVRLVGGPSLLTFGSHNSTGSRGFASSSRESYEVVDAGQTSTVDLEGLSREYTRPDTPGSSRTFGKGGRQPKT